MVKLSFFHSAAFAVIAATSAFVVPAQAQDRGRGEDVDRTEMRAARVERQQQRAEAREQVQQQRAEVRQQRVEAAPQPRAEVREQRAEARQQRSAPEGGWRSQRATSGAYGRDWSNGGAVARPAPAYRGATPQVPERGSVEQRAQRTDRQAQWRNSDRSDRTVSGRTYDRNSRSRATYRDGYRDGRAVDSYRDRNQQQRAYGSGYRSGSNDGYRSGSRDSYRRWNHNDWRRDSRYNWRNYRTNNRSLFSIGRYYSPYRNYSYNRLSIGIFLDNGFYGNRYWINDPWQYRLPEVYGPYRWVRYYDDVLLVDIYSGEVVDVIHDFFW